MKSNWLKYGLAVLVMMVIPSVGQAAKVTCSRTEFLSVGKMTFYAVGISRTRPIFRMLNSLKKRIQADKTRPDWLRNYQISMIDSQISLQKWVNEQNAKAACVRSLESKIKRRLNLSGAEVDFSGNLEAYEVLFH